MARISDEIRQWCEDLGSKDVICTTFDLYALADRIDREMVELPRDRDGVPIHVGDTVYLNDGREVEVIRIDFMLGENGIFFRVVGKGFSLTPNHISHKTVDSWERIADELDEMAGDASETAMVSLVELRELAERIRKLAAKEEDK